MSLLQARILSCPVQWKCPTTPLLESLSTDDHVHLKVSCCLSIIAFNDLVSCSRDLSLCTLRVQYLRVDFGWNQSSKFSSICCMGIPALWHLTVHRYINWSPTFRRESVVFTNCRILIIQYESEAPRRNVGYHTSNDTASHPGWGEYSISRLWKPQDPHKTCTCQNKSSDLISLFSSSRSR